MLRKTKRVEREEREKREEREEREKKEKIMENHGTSWNIMVHHGIENN